MYEINKNYTLDLIKLIACLQVFLGHAINHLNIQVHSVLKVVIAMFPGVPIFFMISGYLIWNSINQSNSFTQFIKKRVWRLYPELWLAVLISVISIVLIKPEIILIDRFLVFFITQGTVLQFWTPECLRSFGCGAPNGALWTICVIVQSYIVLYYINLNFKRGGKQLIVIFVLSLLANILFPYLKERTPLLLYKLICQTCIPYIWLFILGVYINLYKNRIEYTTSRYWFVFMLLSFLFRYFKLVNFGIYGVVENLFLCVGIFGLVFNNGILTFKISKDLSYEIYIYHMIIINVFIEYSLIGKPIYLVYAFFLTIILAYISYITVGIYSSRNRFKISEGL